jgi:ABC-2 type transport system ATP-binding protein
LTKGSPNHTIILSTHILPEVATTCQRVVIINRAVVAVDTPDNLTSRLRGSETLYLQVDAQGTDAATVLERVSGVTRVAVVDTKLQVVGYEVDSESGSDVRRELAAAVVSRGWGLLEMRPMRMSLEEIFLHVTTEDVAAPAAVAEAHSISSEQVAHE